MLAAHFLGRALQNQHLRAIHFLQPTIAFAGHDAMFAGYRAEGRNLVVQHGHRHLHETQQMTARHGLKLVPLTRFELPFVRRPRVLELCIDQVNLGINVLAVVSGKAHWHRVALPHPELHRKLRYLQSVNRLRFWGDLQDPALVRPDGLARQGFNVGKHGQQAQLLDGNRQLERLHGGGVFGIRRSREGRLVGRAQQPELLGRCIDPQLLTVPARDNVILLNLGSDAQVLRRLEGQFDFPPRGLFGQALGLDDFKGGREGARRLVRRRFEDRHQLVHRLDQKRRRRIG